MRVWTLLTVAAGSLAFASAAMAQAAITGAVLPTARSVEVGEAATFFVTMVNSGNQNASNCGPRISGTLAQSIQLRDFPLDDQLQLTGDEFAPINIPAGESRNILLELTAQSAFTGTVPLTMSCNNGRAGYSSAVHDIQFTAIDDGIDADIIAIGLTPTNDAIIQVPSPGRVGIMSVAATNITGPGEENSPPANIRVTPQAGRFTNEFELAVCELDVSSQCITPRAAFLDIQFATGESRFFGVFARSPARSGIALIPDMLRIELVFSDTPAPNNQSYIRARTSAAVTSPTPNEAEVSPAGIYEFRIGGDGADPFYGPGWLYIDTDGSIIGAISTRQGNWQDNAVLLDEAISNAGADGKARIFTGISYGRTNVSGYGFDIRLVVEPNHRIFGSIGNLVQSVGISPPQFITSNDVDFVGAPHTSHYAPETVLTINDLGGEYTVIDERSGATVGAMSVAGNTAQVQTTLLGLGPFGTRGSQVCQFVFTLEPASQGRMADIVDGSVTQCSDWLTQSRFRGRMAWRPIGNGDQSGYHVIFFQYPENRTSSLAYGFIAIPQ